MCLKLKSEEDILIYINFYEPVVQLDDNDLYNGTSSMDIKSININNIELKGRAIDFKKYAFLDIGLNNNVNNKVESHLYLHLENILMKQYIKILNMNYEFSFIDIKIKDEYLKAYSEYVTKKCLKKLNHELNNRYKEVYKKDLQIKSSTKASIRYNPKEYCYSVSIENNPLSIIAAKSETVLSDAHEQLNNFEVNGTMYVYELKALVNNLVEKLEYEEDYLEKELFDI